MSFVTEIVGRNLSERKPNDISKLYAGLLKRHEMQSQEYRKLVDKSKEQHAEIVELRAENNQLKQQHDSGYTAEQAAADGVPVAE